MKPWHERGYRRVILDMHIGDWDEGFLAGYDAAALAESCERARLTSLMVYCVSHVGLCYWPTKHGKMHAGLKGRDIVGEVLEQLKSRGVAACGYMSVVFDNWAFLEHPDWRQQPAGSEPDGSGAVSRYGVVCPNNPDYRAYVMAQVDDLYGRYDFDGAFFDMTFWPTICLCPHCRRRFEEEVGGEVPQVVDWLRAEWCAFQAARERWLEEFASELTARAKAVRPDISVYHNFATAKQDWRLGVPLTAAAANDFLGADLYGDPLEQLFVCKLFGNLTPNQPLEFMTTRCFPRCRNHEQIRSPEEMEMLAFGATLFSGAFMWIDGINLDGTVNPAVYERIGQVFRKTAPYEPHLGGEQVEDIAIYFSSASKMDFRENGTPVAELKGSGADYPHMLAARGAARVLQRAHMPFGVITRRQLGELDRYKTLILPCVARMDGEEVDAVREYVRGGGRLYASRYTSLTEPTGVRHDDFMLADVFGCHFAADDLGLVAYLKPADDELATAITPQAYVEHLAPEGSDFGVGTVRLAEKVEGRILATLTLTYSKEWGNIFDNKWASIHSSPPWKDTQTPALVVSDFGAGRVIYGAADIESIASPANEAFFLALMGRLLDEPLTYSADTHPAVWMTAAHQPENSCYTVGFLNRQDELPAIPIARLPFTLRHPEGRQFTNLVALPDQTPLQFRTDAQGALHAEVRNLEVFRMLKATYA